ncbi:hypothetical protein KFE25_004630 [Diacronema lutheri]|uniref:Uncharacterized protein n=2 Tax=Diacronema lutheri TaxID=2081491 RepID=A0A8J6C7C6_DIALT|nr:hypothetical protein KFE25_004630 [Diacronema lutheri]
MAMRLLPLASAEAARQYALDLTQRLALRKRLLRVPPPPPPPLAGARAAADGAREPLTVAQLDGEAQLQATAAARATVSVTQAACDTVDRARRSAVPPLFRPRILADGSLAMSPAQEIFNALTMLVPLRAAMRAASSAPGDGGDVVAAAIILHFPFSFCYHLACALRPAAHPVLGNGWCKGDLVMIHFAGACMALGTSGSVRWLYLNMAFSTVCAVRTVMWCNTQIERLFCRVLCVVGYIAPIGYVDSRHLGSAVVWFSLVSVLFVLNGRLKGWGHALSHLALGPLAAVVVAAAELAPGAPAEFADAAAELVRCVGGALASVRLATDDVGPVATLSMLFEGFASA